MAKAPKVETLAKSMATLEPGYAEQRGLINEQIEGLSGLYGAQREALEGTRVQSFNQINEQATGRGMAFSGIPLAEQADYLANSYLPGLTNLANQENQERMQYRSQIADLNTQQRNMAVGRIDQQQQSLNQWNMQQAQIEAQRREAELTRQFQREERIAGQEFTASQNAAQLAAQRSAAAAATPSAGANIQQLLLNSTNDKGRVPKSVWNLAIKQAEAAGLPIHGSDGFMNSYWHFRPN